MGGRELPSTYLPWASRGLRPRELPTYLHSASRGLRPRELPTYRLAATSMGGRKVAHSPDANRPSSACPRPTERSSTRGQGTDALTSSGSCASTAACVRCASVAMKKLVGCSPRRVELQTTYVPPIFLRAASGRADYLPTRAHNSASGRVDYLPTLSVSV